MKKKLIYLLILPVFISVFLTAGIALSPQHSFAIPITGPLTDSQFQNLNSGASYGPPPAARFFEPGPITVGSGVSADLFAGPKKGQTNVDQLLFVLSCDSRARPLLGTVNFNIGSYGPISFTNADFFSTDVAGFPSLPPYIGGIANGEVNGIKFSSAFHAGALYYPFVGDLAEGVIIGNVTVMTSVPLRVDIFGVQNGTIINNTPNSGSLGVVPLPTTMLLLGSGLVGLAELRRRFRRS